MTSQVNVQFTDSSETVVSSFFAGPQSATAFPNQGTLQTSSPLWLAFYNSMWKATAATGLPLPDNWTAPGA